MAVTIEKKYDLIIIGASTHLGSLVLKHIHTFLPRDLKWAIVGTVEEKSELEALRRKLTSGTGVTSPEIEISSLAKENITTLVKSTKIVIILPAASVRDETQAWLIEACARNGTHYVDSKSSETCWLKAMISKYQVLAAESGAILLSHINTTGTIQDLLTFCAVVDLSEKLSLKTREAICSFPISNSTRTHTYTRKQAHRRSRDSTPAWYLSSTQGREGSSSTNSFGIRKERSLGMLADSSPSAASNRVLVHRSWGLLGGGEKYGRNFFYNEYEEVHNTMEGIKARLGKRRGRNDIDGRRDSTDRVHLKVVAVADQEGPFPDRALAELVYTGGEMGLTAALIAAAARTLLCTKNTAKKFGSGFLTPAVLGRRYVDWLRDVSVEIECSLL